MNERKSVYSRLIWCHQSGMTWQKLAIRLDMEVHKLEGLDIDGFFVPLPRSDEDFDQRASSRERTNRAKVDAAVRAFASGEPQPELSNDEQYFLEKRFYYAWLLAESFALLSMQSKTKFVPILQSAEDEQAALEWLLIDLWEPFGLMLWLQAEIRHYAGLSSRRASDE